jgi:hypothetical protein
MVCFQTKNANLGQFWKAFDWKVFMHFMAIWNIFWRFGIFYDHLVHFFIHLVHLSGFIRYQEKSGNPGHDQGDQIRRIFVDWTVVNFGHFSEK